MADGACEGIGVQGGRFPRGGGQLKVCPNVLWKIVIKKPEFNLFSDKSARIFFIFPSICIVF
jgi:hypothetical protein